jgi:transcriptional regulator with XRE-family HTH domain
MSQVDLAFRLGVSYGFIGQVESINYPAKYNINHLDKLASVFSCSPKDFLPELPFAKAID